MESTDVTAFEDAPKALNSGVHRAEGCRLHTLGRIVATVLAESAHSQVQARPRLPRLIFVPPRAQQEAFVLSAVWTGLGLNVGQVGTAAEAIGCQLRDQADGEK